MNILTNLNFVLLLLLLVLHAVLTIFKIKKELHIFQLSSYFSVRYVRWLKHNKQQLILFNVPTWQEQKKPLVFTARALRIFIVAILLLLLLEGEIAFWYWQDLGRVNLLLLLLVINLASFALVILANWLLFPVEKIIQYYYIQVAKKILRQLPNLKIIGITGSFGKTTTKYFLYNILRHKFNTLMTPASYNTTMGITKVIRSELRPTHEIFIVEMSAKKPGDIREICELVHPHFGVITALGEQHLETFKTFENIKYTKNELIVALPKDGVAFFNFADPNCRELAAAAPVRVVAFGVDLSDGDYTAQNIKITGYGSSFTVVARSTNSTMQFQTKLLGRHNVANILSAIAIAAELGMSLKDMQQPIRQLQPVPHRLELRRLGNEIIFIDDAFNSNPVGSKMALEVLATIDGKRKIIVTPGMIELAAKEYEYNEQFGKYIAEICGYVILVGKKRTQPIQQGLEFMHFPKTQIFVASSFKEANEHLQGILQAGDVVLFENDLPDNYNET